MSKLLVGVLVAAGLSLGGCYYGGYDTTASLYVPGGALADKHEGSMVLATAATESLNAMFPAGTPRSRVMQVMGAPSTETANSDGTTSQAYMHSFSAYARRFVETEVLNVTYNAKSEVKSLQFSKSRSTF
jgi:hypothetical protein